MNIKATYAPWSGFANDEPRPELVTILGFTEATFEPGYERQGTKRAVVAIIADDSGRLRTAELRFLKLLN